MVEADIALAMNGGIVSQFSSDQAACTKWQSLSVPLDQNGQWTVPGIERALSELSSVDPSSAWQSLSPGVVLSGPQTAVIYGGEILPDGSQATTNVLVVAIEDRTAPTASFSLMSTAGDPLVSPGGVQYFMAPATIAAAVTSIDNVDGPGTGPTGPVFVECDELVEWMVIPDPGQYMIRTIVSDAAGNKREVSQMFEVRDRLNERAVAAIGEVAVVAGDPFDLVSATVFLSSNEFDPCEVNLSTLALWLLDDTGQEVSSTPLRPMAGYRAGGVYDSSLASFDECVWELRLSGQLPSGAAAMQGTRFILTGSGAHGTSGEFDLLSLPQPFSPTLDARDSVLAEIQTDCGCGNNPPPPPYDPACQWRSQFIEDDAMILGDAVQETCIYTDCRGWSYNVWAFPETITGNAMAYNWCDALFCSNASVTKTAASGGIYKVWLEGEDCCDDCTIEVIARPQFKVEAWINPKATAAIAGGLNVGFPGCPVVAEGGVAISTIISGSAGFSTPWGGLSIPILSSKKYDDDIIQNQSSCLPYDRCSITIAIQTYISTEVVADTTLSALSAYAETRLSNARLRMEVSPDSECDTDGDGVPFELDNCPDEASQG